MSAGDEPHLCREGRRPSALRARLGAFACPGAINFRAAKGAASRLKGRWLSGSIARDCSNREGADEARVRCTVRDGSTPQTTCFPGGIQGTDARLSPGRCRKRLRGRMEDRRAKVCTRWSCVSGERFAGKGVSSGTRAHAPRDVRCGDCLCPSLTVARVNISSKQQALSSTSFRTGWSTLSKVNLCAAWLRTRAWTSSGWRASHDIQHRSRSWD
mmetsp:Transcript_13134/g.38613  ORF Transcript_13134/g.38613 Transcript_13134/m.38613 type:complete len:214 (+) Transcript_13134:537-1178(+)